MLVRRRGSALTGWTVTLLCTTFLLVLVGTFLTRSGAVASVHSFTQSPLGPMLLGFVLLVTAAVAGLLIWRAGLFAAGAAPGHLLSRESAVVANAVLLVAFAAIVLTGTVFPLVAETITGDRSAVGPTYFDRAAAPVGLVLLALMGAAPLVRHRHDTLVAVGRRLALPAAIGLATVAVVGLLSRPGVAALLAFGLGAFVLACLAGPARTVLMGRGRSLQLRLYRLGGLVAHAGIAVAAMGIAASSAYTGSAERDLAVGDTITVGSVTARLVGIDRSADGVMSASGVFTLERDGTQIGMVRPELRYFPARDMAVSVPDIRSRLLDDIYITVTGVDQDGGGASVRLSVNPLVSLLWTGGAIAAVGGLVALVYPLRARLPRIRGSREVEETTA
jgi:cytochrome c-type biogenesis protein CcmF